LTTADTLVEYKPQPSNIGEKMNIPPYTLITYLRDKNHNPKGVLVAVKKGNRGNFHIGYSMCRKDDTFDKSMGVKIALGRAETENYETFSRTPHAIRKILIGFVRRCERYYGKGVTV
jgi:hypothetical protein